jgi:hypothetical protein
MRNPDEVNSRQITTNNGMFKEVDANSDFKEFLLGIGFWKKDENKFIFETKEKVEG